MKKLESFWTRGLCAMGLLVIGQTIVKIKEFEIFYYCGLQNGNDSSLGL